MNKYALKLAACALAGAMTIETASVPIAANVNAGVTEYTSNLLVSGTMPTAGVSLAFSQCMSDTERAVILASAQPEIVENPQRPQFRARRSQPGVKRQQLRTGRSQPGVKRQQPRAGNTQT